MPRSRTPQWPETMARKGVSYVMAAQLVSMARDPASPSSTSGRRSEFATRTSPGRTTTPATASWTGCRRSPSASCYSA